MSILERAVVKLGLPRAERIIWPCSVLYRTHFSMYATTSEPEQGVKSSLPKDPPSSGSHGGTIEKSTDASQSPNAEDEEHEYKNPRTGEIGGPKGPEPTRFGDWEKGGRCYDF